MTSNELHAIPLPVLDRKQPRLIDFEADDNSEVPGYRNYLIYTDESGISGHQYFGFGSLWMPWERRGDFLGIIRRLRNKHDFDDEIKWAHVSRKNAPFYLNLIEEFFSRNWLMFHSLICRVGYPDMTFHKDFEELLMKQFALLIRKKIAYFSGGDERKVYHVRVDPLPSRYKKEDEKAAKIIGATLKTDLGMQPLKTLLTRDSKKTPGIQVADFFLGATLADWQGKAQSEHKLVVRRYLAEHLGWRDMFADTLPGEWKFNIWYFQDPRLPREVATRRVKLKVPMPPFKKVG